MKSGSYPVPSITQEVSERFYEEADRIVRGEAMNGDRSWHDFARDQTARMLQLANLHASLVTKIKATRELIYKTQIAAVGGKSRSDCLEVVDGVLGEIEGVLDSSK